MFSNELDGFGDVKIEPVQAAISVARTGASIVATTSASSGTTVLGLTSLAWTGIGIALAIVGVIYSVVSALWNKKKAKRKAKEALYTAYREIGYELITKTYGFEVPGWSHNIYSGQYSALGMRFYNWAKKKNKGKECEKEERELAQWLRDHGLEPTRFMGVDSLAKEYPVDYIHGFVEYNEKYITGKESLEALGYSEDEYKHLPINWFVRLFDIITWIPKAFSELQAKLIKADLEYHLAEGGLDPVKMFGHVLPSELLSEAVKEIHVPEGVISIDLTKKSGSVRLEETGLEPLRAGTSSFLTIGLVLGLAFLMLDNWKGG